MSEEEKRAKKKVRRARGEGSLHRRNDGRWAGSFLTEEGKRVTVYGKSQQEALEKLRKSQYDYQQGLLATGPRQTPAHYLEHWLEEVHKPAIKLTTYAKYRRVIDRHILPELGHLQLKKLTPEHLERLYAKKTREGLSASMVRHIHVILHEALEQATRKRYLAQNVSDLVGDLPRIKRREAKIITREQAQRLIAAAKGTQLEAIVILAITTGMRHGEIIGLCWYDINDEERYLSVRRTVTRLSGVKDRFQGRFEVTSPKTEGGQRTIMLADIALRALQEQRLRQQEARVKAGEKWQEHGLVFANTQGGYLNPDYLLDQFHRLLEHAGLPRMRLHDLRHSAATILLGKGTHPKLVQELLGHSSIDITMDIYSHVLPSMQHDMMEKWDDFLRESE
jgi:integrase